MQGTIWGQESKKKKKNKIKIIQVLLNQKWLPNSKNSQMSEN